MIISHELKYIAYLPEKCASTTLHGVLCEQFQGKEYPARHHVFLPTSCRDYFGFVIARNPFLRELSLYSWYLKYPGLCHIPPVSKRMREQPSFEEYLSECMKDVPSITELLDNIPDRKGEPCEKIQVHQVLKFETLNQDFNTLPFVNKPVKLPIVNRVPRNRPVYTLDSKQAVFERRKADFERFGHSWKPLIKLL